MTESETRAILTICLHAALADGHTSPAERAALTAAAGRLNLALPSEAGSSSDLYTRAQTVAGLAQQLRTPETARLAYEMAISICEADEASNSAERWFLTELRKALGLTEPVAGDITQQAETLSALPVTAPAGTPLPPPGAVAVPANLPAAELDRTILNHAILAGALELLPSTMATMAIVPVQMRLVYQVGKAHGFELDRGHIKDLLATVGVGLASQVVDSYAERAVRGLLGKFVGGFAGGLLGQVTSSGVSFATTYALGQMARQYYAGGRRFGAVELRGLYDSLLGQGRTLQASYLPQIREQAGKVNLGSLTSLIRG